MSNHLLVIECKAEGNTQGLYKDLSDIIEKQSSKKIILITKQNDVFSDNFKAHPKYVEKIDESEFSDLTEASQNKLLIEKTVVFQGCEVSLDELIAKHSRDIIDLATLSKLVSKEDKIVIGSALSSLGDIENYYIDRSFNHRIKIKEDCFKAEEISDLFAISDVAENVMAQLISGKKIRWFGETDPDKNEPIQFILLQNESAEENFKQLCRDYPWKTIHWLKKSGNGLIWQQSQGFINQLKNYVEIDDTDLSEIKERVTIIADTPGMGKSTILTYLAAQEKASNPALWVIRINLVDHVNLLDTMNFHNEDQVIDFLSDTEKLKTELEKKLLHHRLSQQDKIALLLDGFDEISPTYKGKVIQLLRILKKTPLDKIWITTRPHMQHELEDKLQVFSYVLKPFSPKDQERFLKEFWKKHLNLRSINEQLLDVYTQELIELVTRSIRDREKAFTGVPLQTRMLAEAFQEDFKKFNVSTEKGSKLPEKLDLLDLYQRFIQSKYKIFYEEKKKDNINNPAQTLPNEIFEKIANQKHCRLAWDTLFHDKVEFDANEDTFLQELLSSVSDEELSRIGIVQVINDKPNFIHRTFAEYFAAQWFVDELNNEGQNKDSFCKFLKERIFKPDNEVLRNFFDRILAKDSPILTATINNDKKTISDLFSAKLSEYITSIDEQGRTALHLAAAYNHEEIVKELLRNNANVNITDKIFEWSPLSYADKNGCWNIAELLIQKGAKGDDMLEALKNVNLIINSERGGETLLHLAAQEGYIELAKVLTEHGADVNIKGWGTPLHKAAGSGHLDIVQYLVAQGAKINAFDNGGLTPLLSAAASGHLDIVQYLVTQGANVNALDKDDGDRVLYGPGSYYGQIPLCWAARNGHLEVVKYLIVQGAKLNTYDQYGITPLFSAAERGHLDIVQYLVAQGAKINTFDNGSLTPLLSAALRGYLDIVQYLVMQGANVNALDKDDGDRLLCGPGAYCGQIPLCWAATGGHLEVVKYLIVQGAKVNTYDQHGITPLFSAAERGHLDIVQYLVAQGAKINIRTNDGTTPLFKAAESGDLDVVKCLIERGADVNTRCWEGWTPLARAASRGHLDVVKLIIEKGADVLSRNDHDTVLHQAVCGNNPEVIKSILKKIKEKCNNNPQALYQVINAEDTEGDTPLMWAAEAGKTNAIRILLEYGSDVKAINQKGMTALDWAVNGGYLEVVQLLRAHHADPTLPDKDGKTPLDLAQEQLSNNP
jgi:ankyrin repeat protein